MFTELPFSTGSFAFNLGIYLFVFQMEFEMSTTIFNSLLLHWEHQGTSLQLLEQVCYQVRQHRLIVLLKLTAAIQGSCSAQEQGLECGCWKEGRQMRHRIANVAKQHFNAFHCQKWYSPPFPRFSNQDRSHTFIYLMCCLSSTS